MKNPLRIGDIMRVALLSVCLLFTCSSSAFGKFLTLNEIGEAACRVNADDARGSGSAIARDKQFIYILTNAHVVGNSARVTCEFFRYGRKTSPLAGEVIWRVYSEQRVLDFAVIKVPASLFGSMPPRIIPLAPPTHLIKKDDYIAAAGCPQARWLQLWEGHALSNASQSQVLFTPPPLGGQSGSGVYTLIGGHTHLAAVLTWRVDDDKGGAIHIANFWRAIRGEVSESKFDRIPSEWKFAGESDGSVAKTIKSGKTRKRAYYALGSNGYYYLQTFKDGLQYKSVIFPPEHRDVKVVQWNVLLDVECPFGVCPPFIPPRNPRGPPNTPANPNIPIPSPEDNPDGSPGGDGEGKNPFGKVPPNYSPPDSNSQEIQDLRNRISELEKESENLKTQRVELEKTIFNLSTTMQLKLRSISVLERDAEGNRERISELQGEVEEHRSSLDSLNSDLLQKNQEIESHIAEIQNLKTDSSNEIEEVKSQRNIFGWLGSALSAILVWLGSMYWKLRGKKEVSEVIEDVGEMIEEASDPEEEEQRPSDAIEESSDADETVDACPDRKISDAGNTELDGILDYLKESVGNLLDERVIPTLSSVSERIGDLERQMDAQKNSLETKIDDIETTMKSHKTRESTVHVVECPESRKVLDNPEEATPEEATPEEGAVEEDCDCDCGDSILDHIRDNPDFPEATARIKQFIHLKSCDGESVTELAFYAHLYRDAVMELRNNRLVAQRQGKNFKLHHQCRAADAIESYVRDEFLKKISSATLDSHCLYHEAMIGFLYKEAVKRLRRGEFNVLGYKDIALSIDEWVKKEFLRRMGFQF